MLSAEARRDFRSIPRYTQREWGEHQRGVYAERLVSAMQELILFPSLGIARDDIDSGLRARMAGHHVIFYRLAGDNVVVIRNLHKNMERSVLREP